MDGSNENSPAIELRGVGKRYGDFEAVKPLDLVIPRGATYGLLGPNGAGKTTTIRMILRIIAADAGSVHILGEPQSQRGLDRVGYLPEERGVYRRMRVRRLLAFFAELKGVPARVSRARIDGWLERLELSAWAEAKVQELSKGMQQKIQFIGAILHEPDVVILDEPFAGLDPINQRLLREIISEQRQAGRTILFSTHIIEHAERICDHVCIIAHGVKVADGTMAQVKHEHGSDYIGITLAEWSAQTAPLLRRLPGVREIREQGNDCELRLQSGADPQRVLEALVGAGVRLQRFAVTEPSLEQVFIERVGAPQEEHLTEEVAAHV
ncbi:MAG: ATP-binding cassette domain-containing protein [Gemmatimonadetes bacterium]|nr:ATP-binding cassette domain-containing protein [Gemmatimonadota bacterium]